MLIADDDHFTCNILSKALLKSGFAPEVVHRGGDALERLSNKDAPRLALLDWMMPDLSGLEVCRRLRSHSDGAGTYVFLVSGRQSGEDILEGFDAGVDEFIAKPFDLQVLIARLHAAERRLGSQVSLGRRGLYNVLRSADGKSTGEVVVRDQEHVGRVILHQGEIAWIQVSGGLSLLLLLQRLGVEERDARLVLEECQRSRQPFLDTLVAWGLIPREVLRERIREEFSSRLELLLERPNTRSFFIPGNAPLHSGFSYRLDELTDWVNESPSNTELVLPDEMSGPRSVPIRQRDLLRRLARIPGVVTSTLIDGISGQEACSEGTPPNNGLLYQMVRLLHTDNSTTYEEVLLVGSTIYNIIHSLPDRWLIYAQVDRQINPNLGQVRFEISQLTNPHSSGKIR